MKEYDALEQAMDMLILDAAKELCEESCHEDEKEPICFSDEHREKMNALFEREIKEKRTTRIVMFLKSGKNIVWIIVVCSLIMLSSTGIAKDWIERTIKFVFQSDKPNSVYNTNEKYMTVTFGEEFSIEYIPVGFELTGRYKSKHWITFAFKNKNNEYFQLFIGNENVKGRIDSENADATDIYINGTMGKCVRGEDDISVTWIVNEYCINVIGNISEEEILKISRSIKIE